jgi:hypothetical protein
MQYRLSTDNVWQSKDTFIGSDLSTFTSAVLSESENIAYTIPNQLGTRYLLLKADAGNAVAESNENNNVISIPITISATSAIPTISSEGLLIQQSEKMSTVNVYPNPARTALTVEASNFEWTQLTITHLNGQIIEEFNAHDSHNFLNIPVDHLPRGTYVLRLSNAEKSEFVRIILE